MAIEIEKKYRLTVARREQILLKLDVRGANFEREDFEENILFTGGILSLKECVLRLRKTEGKAILTYKESLASNSDVKHRIEHETIIADGAALEKILESLGYRQFLVYEKRRQTWQFNQTEVVVDELPFGHFLEIEGSENEILATEEQLEIKDLEVENSPYPALAAKFGARKGNLIEARF